MDQAAAKSISPSQTEGRTHVRAYIDVVRDTGNPGPMGRACLDQSSVPRGRPSNFSTAGTSPN